MRFDALVWRCVSAYIWLYLNFEILRFRIALIAGLRAIIPDYEIFDFLFLLACWLIYLRFAFFVNWGHYILFSAALRKFNRYNVWRRRRFRLPLQDRCWFLVNMVLHIDYSSFSWIVIFRTATIAICDSRCNVLRSIHIFSTFKLAVSRAFFREATLFNILQVSLGLQRKLFYVWIFDFYLLMLRCH